MSDEQQPEQESEEGPQEDLEPLPAEWAERLDHAVIEGHVRAGDVLLVVRSESICDVCSYLQSPEGLGCAYFGCLSAVDCDEHFELVYQLANLDADRRVRVKTRVPRGEPRLASVTSIWVGADWYEREAYDLFGIDFDGHPDQRRILMPDDWEGHPLRRDYVMPDDPLLVEGPEHDLERRRSEPA